MNSSALLLYSGGHHPRYLALYDIIDRSLRKVDLGMICESGINRGDGKLPDGVTIFPTSKGKKHCWDCNCVDALPTSYLPSTVSEADNKKSNKNQSLRVRYHFEPFAIETTGGIGKFRRLWRPSRNLLVDADYD